MDTATAREIRKLQQRIGRVEPKAPGEGASGSGTVSSVAMTVPAEFSVAGSPITTSGTLAVSKANQNANLVWAGPTSGAAAAPSFRALVIADILDILQTGAAGVTFEDFHNIPATSAQGGTGLAFTQNTSGSSTGVTQVAPPDDASLGVIQLSTGTTGIGRAGIFSYNVSPGLSLRLGGAALDITWRVQVPTLPDGTESYGFAFGLIDAVNNSHTDGVYIFLSNASANFRYITRSNSVETNTDSGLAAAGATWYKGRIQINAAGSSVTFTIDGGSSQTVTTNIPTGSGREVGIGAVMEKTSGTTTRTAYLDFCRFAWSGVSR